jgi:hypothetical protein
VSTGGACTWCGAAVDVGEGFRAFEPAGARRAVFCRLEHVVPWAIRGAHWEAAEDELPEIDVHACSQCGAALTDTAVFLVRERGEVLVPDGFCSVAHLLAWAKAGGRFR